MVHSPDGDTDFFDIVTGILLQGNTLAPCIFIRISIDKIKEIKKKKTEAKTMPDTDYADNLAILANTPASDESLSYSLEQTVKGIGL